MSVLSVCFLFLSAAEPTYYCFEVIKYLDFLIPFFSNALTEQSILKNYTKMV